MIDVRRSGAVKSSLSIPSSEDRIVLLAWSANNDPRLRNVARIAPDGTVKWRASLPGEAVRDCFVSLDRSCDFFVARTYTGQETRFNAEGQTVAAAMANSETW